MSRNFQLQMTGLNHDISTQDLCEMLEHIGPVLSVNLDHPSGFGFISFENSEDAELALKVLKGFDYLGQELQVQRVGPNHEGDLKRAS